MDGLVTEVHSAEISAEFSPAVLAAVLALMEQAAREQRKLTFLGALGALGAFTPAEG